MEQDSEIKVATRVKVFFEASMSWQSGVVTEVIEEEQLYKVYLDSGDLVTANYTDIVEETFLEFLFARKGSFGNWTSPEGWLWAVAMAILFIIGLTSNMGSLWVNFGFCVMVVGIVIVVFNQHYKNFTGKVR